MKKNSEGQVVCEKCGEGFQIGDNYELHAVVSGFYDHQSGKHPSTVATETAQYFHPICRIQIPQSRSTDSIKEALVAMTRKEQQEIYLFLHGPLGRRI